MSSGLPPQLGLQSFARIVIHDDDDHSGNFHFTNAYVDVSESRESALLTVTRTEGESGDVTITYHTTRVTQNGLNRYESALHKQLFFPEGVTRSILNIGLQDNLAIDGNASFQVKLDSASGGTSPRIGQQNICTVNIVDDDRSSMGYVGFVKSYFEITEIAMIAAITVERKVSVSGSVTAHVLLSSPSLPSAAKDGTHYSSLEKSSCTMLEGQTKCSVPVEIKDDWSVDIKESQMQRKLIQMSLEVTVPETTAQKYSVDPEYMNATLAIVEAQLIRDRDRFGTVGFTASRYLASESAGEAVLVIERHGGTSGELVLQYSTMITNHSSAIPCMDSEPAQCDGTTTDFFGASKNEIKFANGVSRQVVIVPLFNDVQYEGKAFLTDDNIDALETFDVVLSIVRGNATLGSSVGNYDTNGFLYANTTVSILDEGDVPGIFEFTTSSLTVTETSRFAMLTVTRSGGSSGTVLVTFGSCDMYHNTAYVGKNNLTLCSSPTHKTTATNGVNGDPASDYISVSGVLTFDQGILEQAFSVEILDDICKDPEDIEIRIHSVVLADEQNQVIPPGCIGSPSCIGKGENDSVIISIIDPEDPPLNEPAWLALIDDPGLARVNLFRIKHTNTSTPFELVLSFDSTDYTIGPLSNLTEVVKALEQSPLVTGLVEGNMVSFNNVLEVRFMDSPLKSTSDLFGLSAANTSSGSVVEVEKFSTTSSATHQSGIKIRNVSTVEIRNTCDRPIQDGVLARRQNVHVEARLYAPYGSPCLRSSRESKHESWIALQMEAHFVCLYHCTAQRICRLGWLPSQLHGMQLQLRLKDLLMTFTSK